MRYANIKHDCNHNIWKKKKLLVVIFDHFFPICSTKHESSKTEPPSVFFWATTKPCRSKKNRKSHQPQWPRQSYSLFFHGWRGMIRWCHQRNDSDCFNASSFSLWMQRVYIKTTCNLQDYMKIRGNLINNNENNKIWSFKNHFWHKKQHVCLYAYSIFKQNISYMMLYVCMLKINP